MLLLFSAFWTESSFLKIGYTICSFVTSHRVVHGHITAITQKDSDTRTWSAVWFIYWLIGCCVPLWTLQLIKAAVSIVVAHSFGGWPAGSETPTDISCAVTTSITSLTSRLMSLRWPVWLEAHGQMAQLFIKMIEAWPHSYDVKELYHCCLPHTTHSWIGHLYTVYCMRISSVFRNRKQIKSLTVPNL